MIVECFPGLLDWRRLVLCGSRSGDRNIRTTQRTRVHRRRPAVTEGQVRQKLQSEGYSNIQIVRQGEYFEATGSKDGQTGRILIDSQTGRLAGGRDEDDD